jgi:hypothetical protein
VTATSENGTVFGVVLNSNDSSEVTAKIGNVIAKSTDNIAHSVTASGMGSLMNVETGSVTAEALNGAIGIMAFVDGAPTSAKTVNITANGDVTAKGPGSVGVVFDADTSGTYNIVVDGTVSGEDAAVRLTKPAPDSNRNPTTNLTVWAAQPNKDGEIVKAYERIMKQDLDPETGEPTGTWSQISQYSAEASKAFEAAINYIVKVAEEFVSQISATAEKGRTVTINGKVYPTAQANENVKLDITVYDNQELEGVYYNNNDKTTLTPIDQLEKDGSGNVLMKMLRGGAMLLGLNIHTHDYSNWVYNNDATCTENGTETGFCACGQVGPTRMKEGTMVGHKFGEYTSNGDATCTQDGTKTAKCERCGETDTVADTGSAMGLSFT